MSSAQPQPVQNSQVVAPGANRSGLVLFLGVSLIFATMVADPAVRAVFTSIVDAGQNKLVLPQVGTPNVVDIGVQVGMVLLLTGVAAVSDEAGTVAVTLLIGLWLVFLVMRVDVITNAVQFIQSWG